MLRRPAAQCRLRHRCPHPPRPVELLDLFLGSARRWRARPRHGRCLAEYRCPPQSRHLPHRFRIWQRQRRDPRRHPGRGLGKLTEATIQHRAAQITFKLVSDAGGEAIADTAWSILTAVKRQRRRKRQRLPHHGSRRRRIFPPSPATRTRSINAISPSSLSRNTDVEVLMKDQQPQPPADAARTVQQVPVGTPTPPGVQLSSGAAAALLRTARAAGR